MLAIILMRTDLNFSILTCLWIYALAGVYWFFLNVCFGGMLFLLNHNKLQYSIK